LTVKETTKVKNLAAELADLRLAAGQPSFKRMETLSKKNNGTRLPSTTAYDATRGARPPQPWVVLRFVAACRSAASEDGIPIDEECFNRELWHKRWTAAHTRDSEITHTTPPKEKDEYSPRLAHA
jgi:hypothetical protein